MIPDHKKTKAQLVSELEAMRHRLAELGQQPSSNTIRADDANFRNLVKWSIQGVLVQRNHKIIYVNQAYAEMHGFESPEEVIALGDTLALRAPHEHARIKEYHNARMRGVYAPPRYDIQCVRKDGSIASIP